MRRNAPIACLFPVVLIWSMSGLASGDSVGSPDSQPKKLDRSQIERLVRSLGDSQFANRERATSQLIEAGIAAEGSLEAGLRAGDPEVRLRCQRILRIVRNDDFNSRLTSFAEDKDGKNGYGLPAWGAYRNLVGESPASRAVFVEMQRAEPNLMQALQSSPRQASDIFLRRCREIKRTSETLRGGPHALGSIAALLFVATNKEAVVSDSMGTPVYMFLSQPAFKNAFESKEKHEALKKLLVAWIERWESEQLAYYNLLIVTQYNLREGLGPARKMLHEGTVSSYLPYAILVVAKLGDQSDIPTLEALLGNHSTLPTLLLDPRPKTTRICDVALAGLLHLTKQNLEEYGFPATRSSDVRWIYNASTLGFPSDSARRNAIKKWRAYRTRKSAQVEQAKSPDVSPLPAPSM